ncbi:hypothetical protein Glove_326g224 [Diversispora epigaea]|uniref:Uncharacterized protein n=1 Tax=Diversispora epigaea TaxID=1348612 RepID=A0A397HQ44_9GLOM|nr:hypothetical protein Glove_326g224 [Diversispora epigaea]
MSTPGHKNFKKKETTENSNRKRIRTRDVDQINRETSDVTEGTQEETQHEGILEGSTRNLIIDKLIMQNAELIKTCNTLNNKIDNLEKIIVEFIENKKEEISSAFVMKLIKKIADETFNKVIYPTQDNFKKISKSVAKKNYREIFNTYSLKKWNTFYLLKKYRQLRGTAASTYQKALFSIFEEKELSYIQSTDDYNVIATWKASSQNNFESIHENSNEEEDKNEDEDEDDDSNNAKAEEESLTSNISHSKAEPIEFPNNAYADLMSLVTNYNLSNEATNAMIHFFNEHSNLPLSPLPKNAKKRHELMEKIKIPTLKSKKHKILTHSNIDYYLFYYPYKGEKAYSEQYTGNWWKNTEASLPDGSKLLSIILYSDVITTDTLGKSSLHPIYISIGNILTKRRNKSDAKQLLGYFSILKAKDKFEKKSQNFKNLVRLTFHNSMKFLLDPLFVKKGIDLEVDNEIYWFFPRISTIICDWPEAAIFSLVYKSTNSNFPCHFCLISKTLLLNTDLSDITFRNNENMQEYFYNNAGQDVSLENIPNYFWSLPSINIYTATVPDRMHHLDLELFHYQIKFTQALLQKQDSSLVGKIDDRLLKIPRFQKFQMFTNGLQSIFRMTAKEYRILMKVMVFVVDNLYEENKNNVKNFVENRKLSKFGAINGYTTETYESLHKDFVKIPYRISNKKNVEDQIIKTLKKQDIINVINKKQKKKKPTKLLNFSSKLFETKLIETYIYFCEKINDPNINDNIIKSFDQFLECFDDFLENILEIKDIKECDIIIYGTVTLENGSIIRAKNKFHDKLWFSNVAISIDSNESSDYQSDEGLCYGKILLMAKIEIKEKSLLNLALVQWYNFKFQKNSYLYNCPLLKLVELYNLIPIETIDNEYFVNKYIS